MDIYAKKGTKIKFTNPNNGRAHDQETAKKHLTVGHDYTVKATDVSDWHTDVFIKEIPGVAFNVVMFE